MAGWRQVLGALVWGAVLTTVLIPGRVAAQEGDLQELVDLHRDLIAAKRIRNDAAALAAVALENYVVIPPGGLIETRDEALRGVRSFNADTVEIEVEVIARHDSTAVLLGTVIGDAGIGGSTPRFARIRFMAVYVRTAGAWRLLAQSNTPCHELAIQRGRC